MKMFTKEAQELAKPCYEALKKISKGKWEWEPEVGEWCFWKMTNGSFGKGIRLIVRVEEKEVKFSTNEYRPISWCIPLLHWEKIEEMLEEMGYEINAWRSSKEVYGCEFIIPDRPDLNAFEGQIGKTRQEAVMQAVIKLGDKL